MNDSVSVPPNPSLSAPLKALLFNVNGHTKSMDTREQLKEMFLQS